MSVVFLWCIGIGGFALLAQIALSAAGFDTDHHDIGGSEAATGLELLSVRSVAAATAVFGAAGLWIDTVLPSGLSAFLALVPAAGAAVGAAWLTRLIVKADSSGSLKLEDAVGAVGTVYLTIPPERNGIGIVQFPLQGRTVELQAYTSDKQPLASGARVLVVSVDPAGERVEVVSTSNLEGVE